MAEVNPSVEASARPSDEVPAKPRRKLPSALLVILALAAVFRLAYVVETRNDQAFRRPIPGLDIQLHLEAARELSMGPRDGPPFALMMASAPAYPIFLATLMKVVGDNMTALRLAQGFLALGLILALFVAGKRIGGELTGLVAAGLAAFYPPLVHFDTQLEKVTPELICIAIAVAITLGPAATDCKSGIRRGLAMGGALAYLVGSQLGALPLAATLFLAIAVAAPGDLKVRLTTVGIAATLMFATLSIIEVARHHDPKLPIFRAQSGIHLRIGFFDEADGIYAIIPGIPAFPIGHVFFTHLQAEVAEGRLLTDEESDKYQRQAAIDWVKANPERAAGLVVHKVRLALSNFEANGNDYYSDLRARFLVLRILPLSFGMLLVLAALGIVALWRRVGTTASGWRPRRVLVLLLLLLGGATAPVILTFVTWRYRLPMLVPMLLLGAAGVGEIVDRFRRAKAKNGHRARATPGEIVIAALAMIVTAVITFYPPPEQMPVHMHEKALANRAISKNADRYDDELAGVMKEPDAPDRAMHEAVLLTQMQRHRETWLALERARGVAAYDPHVDALYVRYCEWLGRPDAARLRLSTIEPEKRGRVYMLLTSLEQEWLHRFAEPTVAAARGASSP